MALAELIATLALGALMWRQAQPAAKLAQIQLRIHPDEHTFVYDRPMADHDAAQRIVLRALLEAHPRLLGIEELKAQLADVPRVHEALRVLVEDGLATRLGDRVGVSRASVRFDALGPSRSDAAQL